MKPGDVVSAHVPVHAGEGIDRAQWTGRQRYEPSIGPPQVQRRRHRLVFAAVLIAIASHAHATTVVVLLTADRIVVAADSRVTHSSQQLVPDDSVCKILLAPTAATAFVAAGAIKGPGFDLSALVRQVLQRRQDVAEQYAILFREVVGAAVLPEAGGIGILETGFVAWEGRRPRMALGTFRQRMFPWMPPWIAGPRAERMFTLEHLEICSWPTCRTVVIFGLSDGIDLEALAAALQRRPKESDMVGLAEGAVQAQSRTTPDLVGGPISSVVIDKRGARWVRQSESCR